MKNGSFSARGGFRGQRGHSRGSGNSGRGQKRYGSYINPQKFVNKATIKKEEVEFVPTHKFTDFKFIPGIERNLAAHKFVTPTPIQDGSIPHVMAGKDVIGLANTGTGKTAAFVLPMIHRMKTVQERTTALIMAPTRELAEQIQNDFHKFSQGLGLYSALCVGGTNIGRQRSALARRPNVVIGTPGRIKDLLNRNWLNISTTNLLVLDEVDRMLDMGFINDINAIIAKLPTKRQSLCFSATITREIQVLLDKMLVNPVTVSVRKAETSEHVEQDVIHTESKEHKLEVLLGLLGKPDFNKVMIFGQTKWGVQRLAETLTKQGFPAEAIHGNKSQPQRQRALKAFKDHKLKVLVATDVAARGLDIPNVSHVINFDQPATYDDYVHRIGRTGRAGKKGVALTFVSK